MTPEQRLFFDTHGFLRLPAVLGPQELAATREAFEAAFQRWKADPSLPGARSETQSQIMNIIEYDDLFLDLMEHPGLLPHIREIIGDDIQMIDNDGHVKPGGTHAHIGWHFDEALPGVHHPGSTMMVKAFFLLSDLDEDGGCTAFIPGSHRFPNNYPFPPAPNPEEMPGHVRMTGKAGDAFFFHGHTHHTSLPNRGARERRVLIYNYGHFFMKQWGGYEPSEALKARAETPLRRQLLGIGDPYGQWLPAGY